MSEPSKQDQRIPTNANVVPPEGWYLRANLTEHDMEKLKMMKAFCEEGVSRVSAMTYAVATFRQNQVYLAHFQNHDQNLATNYAIQQMIQATSIHWNYIKMIYVKFLLLGFCPSPNVHDPCPRPAGATAEL